MGVAPQIQSVTTLQRNYNAAIRDTANGPVFLIQHAKTTAVLLSADDYERMTAELEELKRWRRAAQFDQDFSAMDNGAYVEG